MGDRRMVMIRGTLEGVAQGRPLEGFTRSDDDGTPPNDANRLC